MQGTRLSVPPKHLPATSTVVVFDFDCTLAASHMWRTLRSSNGQAALAQDADAFYDETFGGTERRSALQIFVRRLREMGVRMLVLSKGYEAEIQSALRHLRLGDCFEAVLGCESMSAANLQDKPSMLVRIAIRNGEAITHMLFVDDDRRNFPMRTHAKTDSVRCGEAWALARTRAAATAAAALARTPPTLLLAWPVGSANKSAGLSVDEMETIEALFSTCNSLIN